MSPVVGAPRGLFRWLLAIGVSAVLPLLPPSSARLVAAALPSGATLTILADPVDVLSTSTSADPASFADAVAGQSLSPGDIVRTGSTGLALLTFFDGSESQLGADSQVQIEQADYTPAPQIALLQSGGVTVNRVIPLPPGGSFRTDTPDATGLVRGTSYAVSVDTDERTAGTSMVLLTDRDGHVGHVQLVPSAPVTGDLPAPTVDLVQAGDIGAAAGASTGAGHLDDDSLARLEIGARDLRDVEGAHEAHEVAKHVLRATAPTVAAAPQTAASVASTSESPSPTPLAHPETPLPSPTPSTSRTEPVTTKPEPVRTAAPGPTAAPQPSRQPTTPPAPPTPAPVPPAPVPPVKTPIPGTPDKATPPTAAASPAAG